MRPQLFAAEYSAYLAPNNGGQSRHCLRALRAFAGYKDIGYPRYNTSHRKIFQFLKNLQNRERSPGILLPLQRSQRCGNTLYDYRLTHHRLICLTKANNSRFDPVS